MKPRISVLTLGVAALEKSPAFYRDGLGLPTVKPIVGREFEHGAVAFFELSGGLRLAIWAQDDVAHDTGLPKTQISPTSFTVGHNVVRREEVDEAITHEARQAWRRDRQAATGYLLGGFAGYFRDPNGHVCPGSGMRIRKPADLRNPCALSLDLRRAFVVPDERCALATNC